MSDSEEHSESEIPPPQKVSTVRSYNNNLKYDDAWLEEEVSMDGIRL